MLGGCTCIKIRFIKCYLFYYDVVLSITDNPHFGSADHSPGDAKKQSFNLQGAPSTGEAEPFKFGNPGTAAGSNSLFKFGQTSEGKYISFFKFYLKMKFR